MEADGRIFVNESLTKLNLQIFRYAMSLKKDNVIVGATTFNGIVHIRRGKDDDYIRALSISSIDEFLNVVSSSSSSNLLATSVSSEDSKIASKSSSLKKSSGLKPFLSPPSVNATSSSCINR